MRLPGFVGPSNVLASNLADCERSVNLFQETGGPGTPKTEAWLRRRPGLAFSFSVGTDPVLCLYCLESRAFGAAGTTFFEFFDDGTFVVRGTLSSAPNEFGISMAANNTDDGFILITSGGTADVFDCTLNTVTPVTDPDFPANVTMCEFFAGYFFVLVQNSRRIQWSALEDPTSWDGLDFYERSWAADWINFIKRSGTHIWVVGEQTSEILYATGDLVVFAPAQESLIEHGSCAHLAGTRVPGGVICIDQSERGFGHVVVFRGLEPQSIGSYAINLQMQLRAPELAFKVWALPIQMDGHLWYVIGNNPANLDPNSDENESFRLCPVFDVTEERWHHWAHWDSDQSRWFAFRGRSHTVFHEQHWIGDRLTGAVYTLSFANLSDELVVV